MRDRFRKKGKLFKLFFLVAYSFLFFSPFSASCDTSNNYTYYLKNAKKYYKKQIYDSSYLSCLNYLDISDSISNDVFFASKIASLTGNLNHSFWLLRHSVTTLGGNNFLKIIDDSDFEQLFGNQMYNNRLEVLFDSLLVIRNVNYSKQLRDIFYNIYVDDQTLRRELKVTNNKDSIFSLMTTMDSINLIKVESIIDSLGFLPNRTYVGLDMSIVPFLVIQHADQETRKEFLPFFEQECKVENFPKFVYPYLVDRICMDEGEPQLYGTQVWIENGKPELYKIDNLEKVKARRKDYGLPNLDLYLRSMGISL